MAETFERQLARVSGRVHRVYMNDHQHRMENGLSYYWNKADDLRKGAEILMAAGGSRDCGAMLAGMALEVLLKGIARALDNPPANAHHRLADLADHVGIAVSDDERVLLQAMSEHIYWAGRYPSPRVAEDWNRVWEIQEKQGRGAGKLAAMDNASRIVSIGTFRQIWAKLAAYFDKAQQSRFESAAYTWDRLGG